MWSLNLKQIYNVLGVRRPFWICLILVVGTLSVYWQVIDFGFTNFDDDLYVFENNHVKDGLTLKGMEWSFKTTSGGNWHPLTWWSHMLDVDLHGMNAGRHHLTSVFFHIINTILIFLVIRKITGAEWRSGVVAALFAIHPLHVESVAWISERKDVLSTLFWMLTLWAYVWYLEQPSRQRYFITLILFVFGLMAKPMVVTLPFVLMLLDFWPLGRIKLGMKARCVKEKVPFIILSLVLSFVTVFSQQSSGAVRSLEIYSLTNRIANAMISYVMYIKQIIWPVDLAVLYPHPHIIEGWKFVIAFVVLAIVTLLVLRAMRRHPYLFVGWFWYIGTLVPVIGIIQVGSQAMADRYTYIPSLGLFVIVAWGGAELVSKHGIGKTVFITTTAVAFSILTILTGYQIQYWKDSISLFERTIEVTGNNYVAYNNLGISLAEKGRLAEAIHYYSKGLTVKPKYVKLHNNLGDALLRQGKIEAAMDHFKIALNIKPDDAKAHFNMGKALSALGKLAEAIYHFKAVLLIYPHDSTTHNNLGNTLQKQGQLDEAIHHYRQAIRIRPADAAFHNNMGVVLLRKGNIEAAISYFEKALRAEPGYADAANNLNIARSMQVDFAVKQAEMEKAPKYDE